MALAGNLAGIGLDMGQMQKLDTKSSLMPRR